MGSVSRGLLSCSGSSGSVRDRREEGVCLLLSLVFYKIRTNVIHKLYMGLRFLVCMECREPRHNRYMDSLLTDHMIVSPKVNRTRKRDAQALYSSAWFGDCVIEDSCSRSEMRQKLQVLNF
jgi:hypothetical protein